MKNSLMISNQNGYISVDFPITSYMKMGNYELIVSSLEFNNFEKVILKKNFSLSEKIQSDIVLNSEMKFLALEKNVPRNLREKANINEKFSYYNHIYAADVEANIIVHANNLL